MPRAPLGCHSARAVSTSLDGFFEHYFRRRPVNATFTGVHDYDTVLPDWSRAGLAAQRSEMTALHAELAAEHPLPESDHGYLAQPDLLDAELARAFLEIQLAEDAGMHGVRGNPAQWSGEAVFSIISLMIRDFAPVSERVDAATTRLLALPAFLAEADETMRECVVPASWIARALRDCEGAALLFDRGIASWLAAGGLEESQGSLLREAADDALRAFERFATMLRSRECAPNDAASCGPELYDVLLRRGHQCVRTRTDLLASARAQLRDEQRRLDAMTRAHAASWPDVQARLAADHPAPDDYLAAFARLWNACRETVLAHDAVTWPDWPLRYTTIPAHTREAAPHLY